MPRVGMSSASASSCNSGIRFLAVYRRSDLVLVASHLAGDVSTESVLKEVIAQVLQTSAPKSTPRLTVTADEHGSIHYQTDEGAIYVCVSASDYPQRTAFQALSEFREKFVESFGDAMHKAAEGAMTRSVRPLMTEVHVAPHTPPHPDHSPCRRHVARPPTDWKSRDTAMTVVRALRGCGWRRQDAARDPTSRRGQGYRR